MTKANKRLSKESGGLSAVRMERASFAAIVRSVVRGARHDARMSQEEMGYLMGSTTAIVSNWESGRTDMGVADLILWARNVDVEPGEFVRANSYPHFRPEPAQWSIRAPSRAFNRE